MNRFTIAVLLCTAAFAGYANAQASASTGVQNYASAPAGSFLDEFYFDVDFGSGTVTNCDLSVNITHTANLSLQFEVFVSDALATLPGVAQQANYDFGINYGYSGGVPAPVTGPASSGFVGIWGPNGIVTGNFPVTGVVRFLILVTMPNVSAFPNDVTLDFTTSVGSNVSTAGYPFPVGTNMGYNFWSQVAPGTAGVLGGWGKAGNSDYFQRNHSNYAWGATRFGSATDEMEFFFDIDLGSQTATLDLGLLGFAYAQAGSATGSCVTELYDMQVGWDTPVASATSSTTATGFANGGYQSYTTPSMTGLNKFRIVMKGQNLQNVAYSTNFADFGFELYISDVGQIQTLTTDPVIASPRMAITPGGSVLTASPTTLTATGGTPTVGYNWTIQGTPPAGVSLSAATGSTTDLVFGSSTPAASTVTVRCTNNAGPEFTEETYTLNFGGGGGGGTLTITTTTLSNGQVGVSYNDTIVATATSAPGPYTWSLSSGTLPGGLTLDTASTALTTTLSGNPTTPGTFNFTVQITNGSASDTQSYQVDITASGVLTITTTSLADGTVGTPYSANITAVGGTGNHTWSVTSGTLPAGLALGSSTTGTVSITGTPTTAGPSVFTIQVVDSSGTPQTDTQAFTLTVNTSGGGGGGGGLSGGGGGGGGGCVATSDNAPWMLMLGLLAMFGLALRMRSRRA